MSFQYAPFTIINYNQNLMLVSVIYAALPSLVYSMWILLCET